MDHTEKLNQTPAKFIKGLEGLALFLGVSKSMAYTLKKEGFIPFFQHKRLILFDPDAVTQALIKKGEAK